MFADRVENRTPDPCRIQSGSIGDGSPEPYGCAVRHLEGHPGDGNHFQNFIDAVKNDDPSAVNANALEGHRSSALCHLGNISYKLGTQRKLSEINEMFGESGAPSETFIRLQQHLIDNALVPDDTPFTFGSVLRFNSKTQKFNLGSGSNAANALLTRPEREPFVIPQQV